MRYLTELARIQSDDDTQEARDKISSARKKLLMATKAYRTAKSGVGSKKRGSSSRKRASKYLRDSLNARRTVNTNVKKALKPKTEEI